MRVRFAPKADKSWQHSEMSRCANSGHRRFIRSTSQARSCIAATKRKLRGKAGASKVRPELPTLKEEIGLLELVAGGNPGDLNAVIGPRVGGAAENARLGVETPMKNDLTARS